MITIPQIREASNRIIVLGNHEPIIQSILDFDYLSGHKEGSVVAIVTGRRGFAKYFWGHSEVLIPTLASLRESDSMGTPNLWLLNLLSGRRTLTSTLDALQPKRGDSLTGDSRKSRAGTPKAEGISPLEFAGAALFAENVPELHSLQLITTLTTNTADTKLVLGPSSIGLLVPGILKLGPIGGITPDQINEGKITEPGHIAVLSASGGMTNELMNIATQSGHRLSFALSFGGDRFPVLSPRDAFLLAEADPATEAVLYYGELGGEDEYELVKLKEEGKFTKQVVAHIAGTVASLFPESPQFGHAKAKADKERTTAAAKRTALHNAGFQVSSSFSNFINLVNTLK